MKRVERLKKRLIDLEHSHHRICKQLTVFDDKRIASLPLYVRKPEAFALALKEMPLLIQNDELIVGSRTLYGPLSDNSPQIKTFSDIKQKYDIAFLPCYATDTEQKNGAMGQGYSHTVPDYGAVLHYGYKGMRHQASERLQRAEKEQDKQAIEFCQAVLVSLHAASLFIMRYADEAHRLSSIPSTSKRQNELRLISERCAWIANNPPRTFHEAIQLFYFSWIMILVENYFCMPIGRIDQFLYPFLQKDLQTGTITNEEAQELVECLWIKLNDYTDISTTDNCNRIILGGQTSEGVDATNVLSFMCMDTCMKLRLPDPKIAVRIHHHTPTEFIERCCRMALSMGGGFPAFYNDESIISSLLKGGIPIEDARNYCQDGCGEILIGGKTDFKYFSLMMPRLLGRIVRDYSGLDYRGLVTAFNDEMRKEVGNGAAASSTQQGTLAKYSPMPFLSAMLDGCIKNGRDRTANGATYSWTGEMAIGLADVANELAAIKKLVFDSKKVKWDELQAALAADYCGYEPLRQLLLNKSPKFGNADDYVDLIAQELAFDFCRIVSETPIKGRRLVPGFFNFSNLISDHAGADGRKSNDFISPHLSPRGGTDKKGITANLMSIDKCCSALPLIGAMSDIKMHPSLFDGKDGVRRLVSVIETICKLNIMGIQFNIVDAEVLKKAKKDPDKYPDLLIRVWGFSARFVDLPSIYQDHIIQRTEHKHL